MDEIEGFARGILRTIGTGYTYRHKTKIDLKFGGLQKESNPFVEKMGETHVERLCR